MTRRALPFSRLILACALLAAPVATHAQTRPTTPVPLVAPGIAWPSEGGVVRSGVNGLIIDGGLASVDESIEYSLSALTIDADGVIRFTYADTWTLERPEPSVCDFTFRRVERALTQAEANTLAIRLSTVELDRMKAMKPGLETTGVQTVEGSAVVRQIVDRFAWPDAGRTAVGLSKTWIFVRDTKAYYVNKTCVSHDDASNLIVIDQLIGLNYRPDPVPAA